jgi:hypothetical protein
MRHQAGVSRRWCLANRAIAELLFWRPVPSFDPSPEAFAISVEMVELQRGALADAVANEPDLPWGEGRFTPMFAILMRLLPAAFPLHE